MDMLILNQCGSDEPEGLLMTRKRNKSDSYQYRIVEITIDPGMLSDFAAEDGFGAQLQGSGYSERIRELRIELMKEVRRLINTILTQRQMEVVNLRLEGRTQVEIAEILGIHQTTVHKTLSGNIDYKNGEVRYGGAIKKLKKMCARDERVLEILQKIDEVRSRESEDE